MAESKLKFYIGDITEGGADGTPCTSVDCLFPLVWKPDSIHNGGNPSICDRVPIIFALRCDEGYNAINVKLTFDKAGFNIGSLANDYSKVEGHTFGISVLDIGTVANVNRVVRLFSGFYPDNTIKIYASFTEIKV